MSFRSPLVCLVSLGFGCASVTGRLDNLDIPADELLAGPRPAVARELPVLVDAAEVLAVSAEMEAFLEQHVNRRSRASHRLHQLAAAIISSESYGLNYSRATRTASETFAMRQGNCLSFSNMFVAMARHVGLDAAYQEVDVPPDWTASKDAYVLNRHVNVVVDVGTEEHAVDFAIEDFRSSYDRRSIPDTRALAHFFNNKAVESMQAGDSGTAIAYFRKAIAEHDRRFAPAWTNLGILYLREGDTDRAQACFQQALKVNPGDYVAMSNLAGLYQKLGDLERAEVYHRRVVHHRRQNPYYRYQLAREAFESQDYDEATRHAKYAVRRRAGEGRFYYLLGLCYLKKGNERAARHWLKRAEEVAARDGRKSSYASPIETVVPRHP